MKYEVRKVGFKDLFPKSQLLPKRLFEKWLFVILGTC